VPLAGGVNRTVDTMLRFGAALAYRIAFSAASVDK
jgi:hypothetical protein